MGLYDRDYVRQEPQGFFLGGDRTMVANLLIINIAVFLADMLFDRELSDRMALDADMLRHPSKAWQLITAGFAHSNVFHLGFNMLVLWFFGRDVEAIYGRREFLSIYTTFLVISGLVWAVTTDMVTPRDVAAPPAIGASGAISGVVVLFVIHYPRRLLYIWGVFPVPAWVLCTLYIAQDLLGYSRSTQGDDTDRVAYAAHLGGALAAFWYYGTGWSLGRLVPRRLSLPRFKRRPKLRVHEPPRREPDLGLRVDRILEKISREGEASLTADERRTLEEASRRYQRRRP
ncbi:MAG: rhomboid family intramembrane serine protease [Pirellulales bacterium]